MRKGKNKIKSEHFLIGTIVVSVFLMLGIGYALLSQTLQINGTANITSKWKILFTSAEEKEMNNATTQLKEITNETTLTLNVELTQPGATATYDVVVTNQGDLDAVLSKIEGVEETNSSDPLPIKVHLENVTEGDPLLKGEEKTFQVIVEWDASQDFNETNMKKEISITLTYEQSDNGVPIIPTPGEDGVNMGGQTVALVSSGDGLYEDQYENGRYIYRGQSPNNYVQFNNELWRIIAKETDGTYKIIRDELLPQNAGYTTIAFDSAGYRSYENNTYCWELQNNWGCGVYGKVSGTYQTTDGRLSGTVTEDSNIADYLNGEYYNGLTEIARAQIQQHVYYIGPVEYYDETGNDSISKNIAGEKMNTWTGNIGLVNVSDVLKASTNPACTSVTDQVNQIIDSGTSICNLNYLLDLPDETIYWTINNAVWKSDFLSNYVWCATQGGGMAGLDSYSANYGNIEGVRPVLFLKSSIQFTSGNGSKSQPFQIGS